MSDSAGRLRLGTMGWQIEVDALGVEHRRAGIEFVATTRVGRVRVAGSLVMNERGSATGRISIHGGALAWRGTISTRIKVPCPQRGHFRRCSDGLCRAPAVGGLPSSSVATGNPSEFRERIGWQATKSLVGAGHPFNLDGTTIEPPKC